MEEVQTHTFEPVYDNHSRILILGSFPSVKSRESNFYYGHPRNRFWKLLANLYKEECPQTIEEKKIFLLKNHIAIWDVVAQCRIHGSSDSSIKEVVPVDLISILEKTQIKTLYANGSTAYTLYQKYLYPLTKRSIIKLPSTSPANAAWTMDRLNEVWKQIREVKK